VNSFQRSAACRERPRNVVVRDPRMVLVATAEALATVPANLGEKIAITLPSRTRLEASSSDSASPLPIAA
jgi:hypothetical protein